MSFSTLLHRIQTALWGSRIRQIWSILVIVLGLAAALATLWPVVAGWLWPKEYHVHVLHQAVNQHQTGVWNDFDRGLGRFLVEFQGQLDGSPMRIRDKLELSFQTGTWSTGDEAELLKRVEAVLDDEKTLALVAATSSEESELILRRLSEEDDPPLLLLALATRNDLLQRINQKGTIVTQPGVYRMVPKNTSQAERLATTILSTTPSPCASRDDDSLGVLILREDAGNATFSRDLSTALKRELTASQGVKILVDSAVDSLLTVPQELVDLQAHFLVYIGSQTGAASIYEQMKRLRDRSDDTLCPLPRLLLTDAGLLGDGNEDYSNALVADGVAALPLSHMPGEQADFGVLGADSAKLLREAANSILLEPGASRLTRPALKRAMESLDIEGQAQLYKFKEGENERADFHLWSVRKRKWQHDSACSSDFHSRKEILAIARSSQEPAHLASSCPATHDSRSPAGNPVASCEAWRSMEPGSRPSPCRATTATVFSPIAPAVIALGAA